MSRTRYFLCLSILTGVASALIAVRRPNISIEPVSASQFAQTRHSKPLAIPPLGIPLTFESNVGQAEPRVAFLARGPRLSTFLTRSGIELEPIGSSHSGTLRHHLRIEFSRAGLAAAHNPPRPIAWKGIEPLRARSNYFIGRNSSRWHTGVPHYARAEAHNVLPKVDVIAYGSAADGPDRSQLEFDIRAAPDANADDLRIKMSGVKNIRLTSDGDLVMQLDGSQVVMHKPVLYEEFRKRELTHRSAASLSALERHPIEGAYLLEPDGSVGFQIARHNPHAALVIDPSLSVMYSTFLGGTGEDVANSIAVDSTGKLYIGGTTTSASTFPESPSSPVGPGGGATDFFVAKIDPSVAGANSLVYLTFIGGSGAESGGMIAISTSGDVAITGTTTSADFPVTDSSTLSTGPNAIAVTELDPTGTKLIYSTLFAGNGSESTQNPGGIALDQAGEIFVASDTTSTNLPVTAGAFQAANGGGISDGFLAVFRPVVTAPTPHLKYCTYLGINAQVGIGGVAVDAAANAYIAGFTSDPGATFPTLNGYQTTYAGDPFDAFVIKIRPSGTGASDLAYGTFLGGAALDQALAISVGAAMPATAYVTGTTRSTNFPSNGTNAAFQSTLKGTANAFLSVIAQDATTGMTSLLYSTYLGGTQSDAGLGVTSSASGAVYVAGKTTSWDFPWFNNVQPFTGNEDAFVAKLNPTIGGQASLLYATPFAGTAPAGGTAVTDANGIAVDILGDVYIAGRSTAADFPRAASLANGFQPVCSSCQQLPPAADAFVLAFQESAAAAPSLSFTSLNLNFGAQAVGAQNIPPLFSALMNTGDAPLNVSNIAVSGPSASSFALIGTDPCIGTPMQPRATCSFEVSFSPAAVGPAEAFVTITDDAPGSPHVLSILGIGSGPLAVISPASISFGNQPQGSLSVGQVITMSNQGNQTLHLAVPVPLGPDQAQFVLQDDSCTLTPALAPNSACTVSVVFAPKATGSFQAQVLFVDDSTNVPGTQQIVSLSGTGVAPAPVANVSPGSLLFGTVAVGKTSSQAITLKNLGSAALSLSEIAFTGPDAANFAINSSNTTCPASGGSVAISSSCTVEIDFAPQTSGSKSAIVNFIDNAAGSPQSVSLSAMAIAPTLQISPTTLTFAPQSVGTASPSQTILLSNSGTSPVTINGISVASANASDFSETANCSSVLGAGAICQINVVFKPLAAGNRSASISISDNAAGNPHSVTLAGTATQAAVSISPSSVNFGNQLVGTASPQVAVTVTNSGTGALVIGAISLTGANPTDFIEQNTCNTSIAPAATCAVHLTFMPTLVGTRTASLVIADNAADTPQSAPLNGAATNFAIDPPNVAATSATVTAGQTATYQLDLQSINGFVGPVTLACTGAPTGAVCSIAPNPISLTANATIPFQVNVTTTARPAASMRSRTPLPAPVRSIAAASPGSPTRMSPQPRLSHLLADSKAKLAASTSPKSPTIILVLLILPFLLPPRPNRHSHQLRQLKPASPHPTHFTTSISPIRSIHIPHNNLSLKATCTAVLTLILLLLTTSCGTNNSPTQPSGTPSATYTLNLTVSSPPATPPATLPLTLNIQ